MYSYVNFVENSFVTEKLQFIRGKQTFKSASASFTISLLLR